MKVVFDVNPGSKYKDDIWQRYDIPNRVQLDLVRGCVGDWAVFRWTKNKARDGTYFAAAVVDGVEPDPERPTFCFARIRDFLPFPTLVPLKENGRYAETQLLAATRPSQIGHFFHGNPIRPLWDGEFDAIVRRGFARAGIVDPGKTSPISELAGFEEATLEAWAARPGLRSINEVLRHLPFRAANFRLNVGRAYGYTCAFTGLKLMTGRGHYEAHAAHLRTVADDGPDIVRNGLCVNRSVHWAFDEHLLSIDEAHRPMVARNPDLLAYLHQFPSFGESVRLPQHPSQFPDPVFLQQHRAAFLKNNRL